MSKRGWERFFHDHENARRRLHGLEPLPELPYTEEDHRDDLDTLQRTLPTYRNSPGWQTEEAQALLDEWALDVKERLQKGPEA